MSISWYVVMTKSKSEYIAKTHLSQQDYEIYLPEALVDKRIKKNSPRLTAPLFPGYLFVRLSDESDDWRPIKSTRGVMKLISFADVPAQVPVDLIDALKEREDAQGVHRVFQTDYEPGDTVRLLTKPYELYEAIVHIPEDERVILLMNILGNQTKVEVGYQDIEPITI